MILPNSLSLFADIVATSFSMSLVTFFDSEVKWSTTISLYLFIYFTTSLTLLLEVIFKLPAFTIASVNTIAVVVPSPAVLAVLRAASFIIWADKFSTASSRKKSFATVTPSLVIINPPRWLVDSINTVLPRGPKVLFTAWEIFVIPWFNFLRPSSPKSRFLGM